MTSSSRSPSLRLFSIPRRHELVPTLRLGLARTVMRLAGAAGDPAARVFGDPPLPDPYPAYDRIRAHGPVYRSRLGIVATADHEACTRVLRSPDWHVMSTAELSATSWSSPDVAHPVEHSLLAMNPPVHTRLRRVVAPWFTPRALRDRADTIERTVAEFADRLAERERFDLIEEFATRVPIKVICDLLAVDESRHTDFARWGAILGATIDGVRTLGQWRAADRAVTEMSAYFADLVAARRAAPGDDVVSGLVAHDEEFTARELTATAGLLLGAGFETTRNLIGNGMLALLRHPEQLRLLREQPELAANAVEEVLRYDSPVQSTGRVPVADTELGGLPVRRGTLLGVLLGGANRDPRVFPDPGRFDITRENAREHLAFSGGAHYCLGAGLARLEGETVFRELVTRFPHLATVAEPRRRPTRTLRGLASMPMTTGARTTVLA